MSRSQMRDYKLVLEFILSGKAVFTLVSLKTGKRFTYQISQPDDTPHFVGVLSGEDGFYQFLGTIFLRENYRYGFKSKIPFDAPSAKAFKWFWSYLSINKKLPEELEIWHEGSCGRCGRPLTVPSSIALGFGPTCAAKVLIQPKLL